MHFWLAPEYPPKFPLYVDEVILTLRILGPEPPPEEEPPIAMYIVSLLADSVMLELS
jgi:hypothetical protein